MMLQLDYIAATLEGLEDTIIFKLIDRAQFSVNPIAYRRGCSGFGPGEQRSLFQLRLWYQEEMDARFGRFCVPEEVPFATGLPSSSRNVLLPATGLCLHAAAQVNLTATILERYLALIRSICRNGDDGHYGSSVEHDVYALQALSRRIHYGALYIAESKYRSDPLRYRELIAGNNESGLMMALTRPLIEEQILERVREKIAHAQAKANTEIRHLIDPEVLLDLYRSTVIPLTKKGEVAYLLNRMPEHGRT